MKNTLTPFDVFGTLSLSMIQKYTREYKKAYIGSGKGRDLTAIRRNIFNAVKEALEDNEPG